MLRLKDLNLNSGRRRAIFFTSLTLGLLFIVQSRSFEGLSIAHTRDSASNVFREIQVLRDTNKSLLVEISSLEETYEKTKDSSRSIQALEDEIRKFSMITGGKSIHGPGIRITVPKGADVTTLIDLFNELYNSGAEAVSLNGVRLTGNSFGLDTIPNGQILLRGNILESPYVFLAIGESGTMEASLRQTGGFLRRFEKDHPGRTLKIEKRERVDMEKV